jgi:hypothetical protein
VAERAPDPRSFSSGLIEEGPLSTRLEARRASVATLRATEVMRAWLARARTVRFFDDDYVGAQLLLEEGEGFERVHPVIQRILREVEL